MKKGFIFYFVREGRRQSPVSVSVSAPVIPDITVSPQTFPPASIGTIYPSRPLTYSGGTAPVTWELLSGSMGGLSLDQNGLVTGTPTEAGLFAFTAKVTDANGMTDSEVFTVSIADAVTVPTQSAPQGVRGRYYTYQIIAAGGVPPYRYTDNNNRPSGLTIHPTSGLLYGLPDTVQTVTIGLTVTDSEGRVGTGTVTVQVVEQIAIETASLPNGSMTSDYGVYNGTMTASGGTAPYVWSMSGQPSWMTIDSSNGHLAGVPSATGTTNITFYATDANGRVGTRVIPLTVTNVILDIVTSTLGYATVGEVYGPLQVSVSGGVSPYLAAITNGTLPYGMRLDLTSNQVSGTPQNEMASTVVITAVDSDVPAALGTRTLSLRSANPVTVPSQTLATGTPNVFYSQQLNASGGYGAKTFTVVTNQTALTAFGLSLDSSGLLSGTPNSTGSVSFTVRATDTEGRYGDRQLSVTAISDIVIDNVSLATGIAGTTYSDRVTASGGTAPYTFRKYLNTPSWLICDSDGTLRGTCPTTSDTFAVSIEATDSLGSSTLKTFYLFVQASTPSAVRITTTSIPDVPVSTSYPATYIQATGGSGTYTFTKITTNPSWISINSSTGLLSGTSRSTPLQPISSPGLGIRVADSASPSNFAEAYYIFNITPAVTVSITTAQTAFPSVLAGASYSGPTLAATGGTGPYTFSRVTAGTTATFLSVASGGAVTGTAPATAGSYTLVCGCVDSVGNVAANRSYTVTVTSATVTITPQTLPTAYIGQAYRQKIYATGGTGPYQNWVRISGTLPSQISVTTDTVDGYGLVLGTPDTAESRTFAVQCTDSLLVTASASFSMNVLSAPVATGDWAFRSALPNVTMKTRFETSAEVHDYAFRSNSYLAHPNFLQQVSSAHPDYAVMAGSGNETCMRTTIPAITGNTDGVGGSGDTAVNWVRKLNDSWGTSTTQGFGAGSEFWVYTRLKVPSFLANSSWVNLNADGTPQSGAGWKIHILNKWVAANTYNQLVVQNTSYRDFIHGYSRSATARDYSGWQDTHSRGRLSPGVCTTATDYRYQPVINHTSPATHPAGLDPTTGSACEIHRKSSGGTQYMTQSSRVDDAYATRGSDGNINPRGSDQSSGGFMWRRDAADQWIGVLHHVKVGTINTADSIWEVWAHKEGKDYIKLYEQNDFTVTGVTEALGGHDTIAYGTPGTLQGSNFSPAYWPPYSALWLVPQNPGRMSQSNTNPADPTGTLDCYIYYGEVICRTGPAGIPAPGFVAPPVSLYGTPSYISSTPGAVTRLTSVSGSYATLDSANPASWVALGNVGRNIVTPWNGFTWDYANKVVYSFANGGHSDCSNNGTFVYDFKGTTTPAGWSLIDISAATAPVADAVTYSDGRCPSAHSYNAQAISSDGRHWRWGGSRYGSTGSSTGRLWCFDPSTRPTPLSATIPTGSYTDYGSGGMSDTLGAIMVYVPTYNKLIVMSPTSTYRVFNCATNTWEGSGANNCTGFNPSNNGAVGAYDTFRNRLLILGNSSRVLNFTFNGSVLTNANSANTITTFSGPNTDVTTAFAPAFCYDSERDCFWAMDMSSSGASANAVYGDYLYRITPPSAVQGTLTFEQITLTGDDIDQSHSSGLTLQPRGGYGKIGVLAGWDALGVLSRVNDYAYVIKKPT